MTHEATTVVGATSQVSGSLRGDEDLRVFGRVDGTIEIGRSLVIEANGIVVADVQAASVVVAGTLVGNVAVKEMIHVTESGRVVGDIVAPRLIFAEGCAVRGQIDMTGAAATSATAADRPGARRASVANVKPQRPSKIVVEPTDEGEDEAAEEVIVPSLRNERRPLTQALSRAPSPSAARAAPAPRVVRAPVGTAVQAPPPGNGAGSARTALGPRPAPYASGAGTSLLSRSAVDDRASGSSEAATQAHAAAMAVTHAIQRDVARVVATKKREPQRPPTTAGKKARLRRR